MLLIIQIFLLKRWRVFPKRCICKNMQKTWECVCKSNLTRTSIAYMHCWILRNLMVLNSYRLCNPLWLSTKGWCFTFNMMEILILHSSHLHSGLIYSTLLFIMDISWSSSHKHFLKQKKDNLIYNSFTKQFFLLIIKINISGTKLFHKF